MYLDDLIKTYKEIAMVKIPELNTEDFVQHLSDEIKKKKYDVQDQTFIENALKDDKESFIETFDEMLDKKLSEFENEKEFILSDHGKTFVIESFLKTIDYTVDLFYNAIISKQFSDT